MTYRPSLLRNTPPVGGGAVRPDVRHCLRLAFRLQAVDLLRFHFRALTTATCLMISNGKREQHNGRYGRFRCRGTETRACSRQHSPNAAGRVLCPDRAVPKAQASRVKLGGTLRLFTIFHQSQKGMHLVELLLSTSRANLLRLHEEELDRRSCYHVGPDVPTKVVRELQQYLQKYAEQISHGI